MGVVPEKPEKNLKAVISTLAVLAVVFLCGFMYIQYIRNSIHERTHHELKTNPLTSDTSKEWQALSYAQDTEGRPTQPNPIRVIALAETMAKTMDPFQAAKHTASSFYSQVKYLVKMKQVPTAIAFYLESRKWAAIALEQRHLSKERKPIDLETLGATDFAVAMTVPVVGPLFFKKSALMSLIRAEQELDEERNRGRYSSPLTKALIWSKLYALTGNVKYYYLVMTSSLTSKMDRNTLARIANHMGFDTVDQLLQFCNH